MTFGREWALWLVPAAFLLPAAVRLLLRPPQSEVRFGAMILLKEALSGQRAERRYRRALALLLRCLGAASAAFAFSSPLIDGAALPFRRAAAGAPSDTVFLLDRSYSMRAVHAGSDRFSLAAETAAAALRALGPEDRAALVIFDSKPAPGTGWSQDADALARRALSAVPGWGTTDYGPALEAAFALLSDGTRPAARKSVLLLSDGSADGLSGMKDGFSSLKGYNPSFRVAALAFSDAPANSWVRAVHRPSGYRPVEAVVAWNKSASSSPPVRVSLCGDGGALLPGPPLRRTGGASGSAVLGREPAEGCVSAGPDMLPADDRRYYSFGGTDFGEVPVLHPGPEDPPSGTAAYFIKKLFASAEGIPPPVFRHYGGAGAIRQAAGPLVLAGLPPFSPENAAVMDGWFSAGGTALAFVSSSRPQAEELRSYFGLDSPGPVKGAFSAVGWKDAVLPGFSPSAYEAGRISASALYPLSRGGYDTLLEFEGPGGRAFPALVEVKRGRGRAYIWTASLDLGWCDLAVKPAFPAFFYALLDAATGGSGARGAVIGSAGTVRPTGSPSERGAEMVAPSGGTVKLRARLGLLEVPPQEEPGLYRWRSGAETGFYAVNLDQSSGESDLQPAARPPWTVIPAVSAADGVRDFLGGVQAWPLFILLAAALLSLEAAMQRRRP